MFESFKLKTISNDIESIHPGVSSSEGGSGVAAVPMSVAATGLRDTLIVELILKHLYMEAFLSVKELSKRCGLNWHVIEEIAGALRDSNLVERKGNHQGETQFNLTDKGRALAAEYMRKCAYVGVAPVPIELFRKVVQSQSVFNVNITPEQVNRAYEDVVMTEDMKDTLGAAVLSGTALMLFGRPGTGKSFIAQRIRRLLGGDIFVPHAITVGGQIVQYFDPMFHVPCGGQDNANSLLLEEEFDPRFIKCERPAIVTGGELTLEMLDLEYDATANVYHAPTQLKANNGLFIVDDLGRQRVKAMDLLNRWIVPLEEKRDFMSVGSGNRFEVPTDFILIFSTNIEPKELADDAFLRRLGYKLKFEAMEVEEYARVWHMACEKYGIEYDSEVLLQVMERLYIPQEMPLLPCHPRDLIGKVVDFCKYRGEQPHLTFERMEHAWRSYFA